MKPGDYRFLDLSKPFWKGERGFSVD